MLCGNFTIWTVGWASNVMEIERMKWNRPKWPEFHTDFYWFYGKKLSCLTTRGTTGHFEGFNGNGTAMMITGKIRGGRVGALANMFWVKQWPHVLIFQIMTCAWLVVMIRNVEIYKLPTILVSLLKDLSFKTTLEWARIYIWGYIAGHLQGQ